ncbi:hypothetical protein AB3N04_13240 [Alkalihalophilus sp. As8PL]|uniref:Uncharacterized protein n=1 Tax=Alkalihalophilus sp. As8PL TaxID=3237103 RepID=A0AB39BPL3_9BACI
MRLLALIGWLIILFLFTFVDDLRLLVYHQQITLNLTRHPDFSEFASLYSVGISDRFLAIVS